MCDLRHVLVGYAWTQAKCHGRKRRSTLRKQGRIVELELPMLLRQQDPRAEHVLRQEQAVKAAIERTKSPIDNVTANNAIDATRVTNDAISLGLPSRHYDVRSLSLRGLGLNCALPRLGDCRSRRQASRYQGLHLHAQGVEQAAERECFVPPASRRSGTKARRLGGVVRAEERNVRHDAQADPGILPRLPETPLAGRRARRRRSRR